MRGRIRRLRLPAVVAAAAAALAATTQAGVKDHGGDHRSATETPIQHLVVIFQENVSFDHYFGTYPNAANTDGQPFVAAPHTPAVDGLKPATSPSLPSSLQHSSDLTATNPNASLPVRLDSSANGPSGTGTASSRATRTTTTATSSRRSTAGSWTSSSRASAPTASSRIPAGTSVRSDDRHGLLRRELDDRALELRAAHAMTTTRRHDLRPVRPGAINLASGDTSNVDTAHKANAFVATSAAPNADVTPTAWAASRSRATHSRTRTTARRMTPSRSRERTSATSSTRPALVGLVRGRLPADQASGGARGHGNTGQPTARSSPTSSRLGLQTLVPRSSNQGLATR